MQYRYKAFFFLFLYFLVAGTIDAQILSSKVTDPSAFKGKEGVFYFLPHTLVQVNVTCIKKEMVKGPYSEFAYRYLGLDQVITSNTIAYELHQIQVEGIQVPDPETVFFAEFLNRQNKDQLSLMIHLSEQGFIQESSLGIQNAEQEEAEEIREVREEAIKRPGYEDRFHYYATNNQVIKVDTIIKMVTIDTSTFKDVSYRTSLVYKTLEERAAEAAAYIETIREERVKLLTGYQEVNYSKEALAYMDSKLKDLEDQYLSLFKGLTYKTELTYTMTYLPDPEKPDQPEVLFKFTSDSGIKGADNPAGEPISVSIAPIHSELWKTQSGHSAITSAQGIVYRMPEVTRVTILHKGNEIISKDIPVSQLGQIAVYPTTGKYYIQFHPGTGAVKRIRIE
jgi:hypothetical protein